MTAEWVAGWLSLGLVRAKAQGECCKMADTTEKQREQHSSDWRTQLWKAIFTIGGQGRNYWGGGGGS